MSLRNLPCQNRQRGLSVQVGVAISSPDELQDCQVSIAPKFTESILRVRLGASAYCESFLKSGTDLVIPIHTIRNKPYQKAPGYYYTPTWMFGAPDWAFPMYSVGDNLLALCKAYLKESYLSCDCTIYDMREVKQILYCPSQNSVPGPLKILETQHCELFLPLDESAISRYIASGDTSRKCSSSFLIEIDKVIDRNRPDLTPGRSNQRGNKLPVNRIKVTVKQSALEEGLDTSLDTDTLQNQLKQLKWKREMIAEADMLEPGERAAFIEKKTKRRILYVQSREVSLQREKERYVKNREKRIKEVKANQLRKSAASGKGIDGGSKKRKSGALIDFENDTDADIRELYDPSEPIHDGETDGLDPYVFPLEPLTISPHLTFVESRVHAGTQSPEPVDFDRIFDDDLLLSSSSVKSPTDSDKDLVLDLFKDLPSPK